MLPKYAFSWIVIALLSQPAFSADTARSVEARRLPGNPIILPEMLPS